MSSTNDPLKDPFSYFTTWSLLVSYSIFIWTLILGAPKWLFLFAACLLTTTSILGTFFITIPNAKNEANKNGTTVSRVILEDTMMHSGPFVLFLLLFNVLNKSVVQKQMTLGNYGKMILIAAIVIFAYLGYIKFQQIYFYDYFTLIVLSACIFITSFQIYSSIIGVC